MKKTILLFSFFVFAISFFAQKTMVEASSVVIGSEQYHQLKVSGQLGKLISSGQLKTIQPGTVRAANKGGNSPLTSKAVSSCYRYFPPNGPPDTLSDDQSQLVNLPFSFCFYGASYTSLYVNDNGTVSFNLAHGAFSSQGFPFTSGVQADEIIAPFWADFHQDGALSGKTHWEIFSDAIVVHWENVGYFNAQDDKLNTMMLVLTDGSGSSPLIQPGSNVGFFYEDMQWTTGSASFGVNGFGGDPATVGVNRGDGIDFIQIGQFDAPGSAYDGPDNSNDGVDWLDNKTFMFNVCNSNNIAPIVAGIDFCDTVRVCIGDTIPVDVTFLAPEINQTIWCSADTSQASGFQITNNTSGTGPSAQLDAIFIGGSNNIGVNVISYTAYDNAISPDTISFDYVIVVDTLPFLPEITGDTVYCQGGNVVLDAGSGFDTYIWSNDSTNQTTTVTQGSYSVQAFLGGCSFTTPAYIVTEFSNPVVQIIGDTLYCPGDSSLLNASIDFDEYLWSSGSNDTLDSLFVTQGSYFVTVTDSNSCQGTSNTINVVDFNNTVSITGNTAYCLGDSVLLDAGIGFDSYSWSTSTSDTLNSVYVTQGAYNVTVTKFGCTATDSITVSLTVVPVPMINDTSYCIGSPLILNADPTGVGYDSFSWNTSPIKTTQAVSLLQGVYEVMVMLNGCSATSLPFTVTEKLLPTPFIIGDLHYCSNDSNGTTLTTANIYPEYNWSNNDTTKSTLASDGIITITVKNTDGCYGTTLANITQSAPEVTIFNISEFCPGEEITLIATSGLDSYLWDSGEMTENILAGSGIHTVTVTDISGCEDSDTVNLVEKPAPIADFTISPVNYQEPNLPVIFNDASTTASGSLISWDWDFDANNIGSATPSFSSTQTGNTVEYNMQGTYSISLIVIADNGCMDTIIKEYLIVDDIVASTVITPNGDGYNDYLAFKNLEYYPNNKLTIFSRWGSTIFEEENYQNDWDGDSHAVGTYFFILTVDGEEPLKGSFTILE